MRNAAGCGGRSAPCHVAGSTTRMAACRRELAADPRLLDILDNPHGRMQAYRGGRWVGVAKHGCSGVRWGQWRSRLPARLASAAHSVIAVVRTGRRHVDEYGPLRNVRRPGRRQRACWPRREWRRLAGGCGCAVAARDRAGRYVVAAGSFRNRARPGRCRLRAPVGGRPPSSERMNADGSDPAREV